MRKGMWCLVAAAGLGLAAGCQKNEGGAQQGAARAEQGYLGEERAVEQPAPLEGKGRLGGENVVDQEAYGTVTSVSPTQFVVRDDEGTEQTFRIEQETRFMRDGAAVQRGMLREGTQVRTSYDERDGAYIADEVTLQSSGSGAQQAPANQNQQQND
jgi:hypothetical protein